MMAWPTVARFDVSTVHEIDSAVSVADNSTRPNGGLSVGAPNKTNVAGAQLHVTLAQRVRRDGDR